MRNPWSIAPLTPKEQRVFEYLKKFWKTYGHSPSYEEIRLSFGFASIFSVQQYLKQLEKKGWIKVPWKNQKRAIEIVEETTSDSLVPLLGRVAAGYPIEAIEAKELMQVPQSMLRSNGEYYALRVKGDSMLEEGILDQDIVVIREQQKAENGQTVVALIDGEATIKKYYRRRHHIELIPANPNYKTIFVKPPQDFRIQGILCGVIRQF